VLFVASVNGSHGESPDGKAWSSNLLNLVKYFKEHEAIVVLFCGNNGGSLKQHCDFALTQKSRNPYIVEGLHSVLAHILVAKLKYYE